MLCGRLPFDDEYIPTLFKKINSGIYSLPSYLSADAASLLSSMLVVDPVKRITITEIRQLPWFQTDLPRYLQPLPITPAALENETGKEFDFGMTSSGQSTTPLPDGGVQGGPRTIYSPDLGLLSRSIVEELQSKIATFTADEILDLLQQPGDNQLKVAYQLVQDHRRMVRSSEVHGDDRIREEMKPWLGGGSPPAWNEGLEERRAKNAAIAASSTPSDPSAGLSTALFSTPTRQTSIKRPIRKRGRDVSAAQSLSAFNGPDETSSQVTDDANETFASDTYDTEIADADADDAGGLEDSGLSDEDGLGEDEILFTDEELDQPLAGAPSGISILETSLPSRRPWPAASATGSLDEGQQLAGSALPAAAPAAQRRSRPRWHFGIRSRSPPMEIIIELYRTLEALGMEWRTKKPRRRATWQGDNKGLGPDGPEGCDFSNDEASANAAQLVDTELFFIETRCRVGNVIVRMDLQLYSVDANNYLVDFRNVTYLRLDPTPPLTRKQSASDLASVCSIPSKDNLEAVSDPVAREAHSTGSAAYNADSNIAVEDRDNLKRLLGGATATKPSLAPAVPEGRKEVCSPFLFLECATRLIVELAGGG